MKGFTLVEIMVAMGLISTSMLAMTSYMTYQAKAQRTTALTSDFQNLAGEIQLALGDISNCSVTFAHPSYAYIVDLQQPTPPPLAIPAGQGIFFAKKGTAPLLIDRSRAVLTVTAPDSNQMIARYGSGLQITQLQLQEWTGVAPNFFVNLYIQAQKYPAGTSPIANGSRLIDKRIPLQIVTDTTGRISVCGQQSGSLVPIAFTPTPGPSIAGPLTSSPTTPPSNGPTILTPTQINQAQQMMQNALQQLNNQLQNSFSAP